MESVFVLSDMITLFRILNAREAALTSRKNCVEEWMAWHAKLRTEEDRVARMEHAALKLVTATSSVFSQQERSVCPFIDTTVSSDTSDIEGRIELLTERLAERRIEMSRLKREARKQTKQKLRALEANLLNQIKKYDTTIHEMRKKLESKKGTTKDSDKLAIESRSLADFKVPEIPLKKIQDIFKSSDLLRSRSESDLLSTKRPTKELMKNINLLRNENIEIEYDKYHSERVAKSSRSIRTLEQLSFGKAGTVNSIQSCLDECISEQIESDKPGLVSPVSDDVRSDKSLPYERKTDGDEVSRTRSSEDVKTDITAPKSETGVFMQSETKLSKNGTIESDIREYKSDFDTFSEQSRIKSVSSQSGADQVQDTEYSHVPSRNSDVEGSITEISTEPTNEINDFSRKLGFLRLNNKNLDEDISSLENELKILSEMMSRISKKPNEESRHDLQSEDKNTSKDVAEILLKSDKTDEINDMKITKNDRNKELELDRKGSDSDISQYLTSSAKLKTVGNFRDNKSVEEVVDNVMSVILPVDETSQSRSNREIDYKARSKEILNEIEKSIISEHIKATENDFNRSNMMIENNESDLYENLEKISNDTSVEARMKSLSEIYSEATQDRQSISTAENASEIVYPLEEDIDIEESLVDSHNSRSHKSLQSNKNSLTLLEQSNLLEKDKMLNLYTDIDRSATTNTVSTIQSHSENNNDIISKELPYVTRQTSVTANLSQLSKKQSAFQSTSPIEKAENFEESIDFARDDRHQSFSDVYSVPKLDDFTLKTNEYNDKNESSLLIQNEIAKSKEASQKSVAISEQGVDHPVSFIRKEIIQDESQSRIISVDKTSFDRDDWTISDSFDVQQDVGNSEWEKSQSQNSKSSDNDSSEFLESKDISQTIDNYKNEDLEENALSDIEDVSLFVPKGESTNIDTYGIRFDETIPEYRVEKANSKIDDILDIIANDTDIEQNQEETVHTIETDDFQRAIYESVTKILDKVEKSIDDSSIKEKIENHSAIKEDRNEIQAVNEKSTLILSRSELKDKLQGENEIEFDENEENIPLDINIEKNINQDTRTTKVCTEPVIDIKLHVEIEDDENTYHVETKSQGVVITELEPGNVEGVILSELEIDAKVELAEEETVELSDSEDKVEIQVKVIDELRPLELTVEQDSSDGEQLDNLVEVVESILETIEKETKHSIDSVVESELISHDKTDTEVNEVSDNKIEGLASVTISEIPDNLKIAENCELVIPAAPTDVANKTFNILKDPEYEDISEESLEVSEIFDKSEVQKSAIVQKSSFIPERYEVVQKSEEVLRILDEITQKSASFDHGEEQVRKDKQVSEYNEQLQAELSNKDDVLSIVDDGVVEDIYRKNEQLANSLEIQGSKIATEDENRSAQMIAGLNEEEKERREQDASSESSEGRDTPKGVSEIEMDSPRDLNDSRLAIDALNDDLLNDTNAENQNVDDPENAYHTVPIVTTSEKDIEVMIDKLKASLEQPGLEVAEFEAKLLRIEQLQIELEIKKLEAEEVSYYVREIPNKPPPPYTPPGGSQRVSPSLGSPSSPPAVIPSNIEELTAFTEKVTAIIFRAKEAGEDIMSLEAPPEIYVLTKENDETVKKDIRIYNTFLFDLCKETIAEVYQAEYEKPGPSWTKPSVKTRPMMKIPKTIDELNEYVNKEVATLFGFKTKLQRENMVMRWSRKRRDRVDELLAREAQAEEDEWTKFHHDELAVKNGLTVAILDTLIMETVNVVKVAYAKKRKVMV